MAPKQEALTQLKLGIKKTQKAMLIMHSASEILKTLSKADQDWVEKKIKPLMDKMEDELNKIN